MLTQGQNVMLDRQRCLFLGHRVVWRVTRLNHIVMLQNVVQNYSLKHMEITRSRFNAWKLLLMEIILTNAKPTGSSTSALIL